MGRRRTIGYIQNEWTCPNCGTRNKGGTKTCQNCGAPQPENVKFELPSEQKLVTDQDQIKAAQSGADIHCPFCGTRNTASAKTCSQCGGDLTEGKAREAGQIMQAPAPQPKVMKCANCGAENPGSNSVCSNCGHPLPKVEAVQAAIPNVNPPGPVTGINTGKPRKTNWLLIGGILAFLAACCVAAVVLFALPTKSVQATVTAVHWETSVPLQKIQAVRHTDEKGNPPPESYDKSSRTESHDVCQQKTVDKGNGYSEVVEECHTETDTYWSYTMDEWTTIQNYTLNGNDLNPIYDSPNVSNGQRLGNESEELTVTFSTEKGEQKEYSPGTVADFQQFEIGSTWTLKMNAVGGIMGVEP